MIPLIQDIESSQIPRPKVEWGLLRAAGVGNRELLFNGRRVSVWEDERALVMVLQRECI